MSFSISKTIQEMSHRDKDHREMAAEGLFKELEGGLKTLGGDEKKLMAIIIGLLEDAYESVRNRVNKCVGPLVRIIGPESLDSLLKVSVGILVGEKEESRVIGEAVLKQVIKFAQPKDAPQLVSHLVPNLLKNLQYHQTLEITAEFLGKFGADASAKHSEILEGVLPHLSSRNSSQRKRAISSLTNLALSTNDKIFSTLIDKLIQGTQKSNDNEHLLAYLLTIVTIGSRAGYKLKKFVSSLVPVLISQTSADDDEIKEICFQGLEILLLKCPKEVTPKAADILKHSIKYTKYEGLDPDEGEEMEEEQSGGDDEDDDDLSYDDTWKVRKGALKCIRAIIAASHKENFTELYKQLSATVIGRFHEKAEVVQAELLSTYLDLIKNGARFGGQELTGLIQQDSPKAVQGIIKQLKQKSPKGRRSCYSTLSELCSLSPQGSNPLGPFISGLASSLDFSLFDKTATNELKTESLSFIRILLSTHQTAALQSQLNHFATSLIKAAGDSYYRASAEALLAIEPLVSHLVAAKESQQIKPIFDKVWNKVTTKGEKEEKLAAMEAFASLLAKGGDQLKANQAESTKFILERLKADVSFLPAAKVILVVSGSPSQVDLAPILGDAIKELISGTRKIDRTAKQTSFLALQSIAKNWGSHPSVASSAETLLLELSGALNTADLSVCALALQLATNILAVHLASAKVAKDKILPKTLELLQSGQLSGSSLQALVGFYRELAKSGNDCTLLFDSLTSLAAKSLPKQASLSIAVALGSLSDDLNTYQPIIKQCLEFLKKQDKADLALFGLLSLGEIGKRKDLSGSAVFQQILQVLSSGSEDLKIEASYALGNVAAGNLTKFLPQVTEHIEKDEQTRGWLLRSLSELVSAASPSDLEKQIDHLLPIVLKYGGSTDGGFREASAESLGKLVAVAPNKLIPLLQKSANEPGPLRGTVAAALKFSIVHGQHPADKLLAESLPTFTKLISDPEIPVKRALIISLDYIATQKPELLNNVDFKALLPELYSLTSPKEEWMQVTQVGIYKLKIDEGLELRKANYTFLLTILSSFTGHVDVAAFSQAIFVGLKDPDDVVKKTTYKILSELSRIAPGDLLVSLESGTLVDSLKVAVGVKPGTKATDELLAGALKAVAALKCMENAESSPKLQEFLNTTVLSNPALKSQLESFETDLSSSTGN